MFILSLGFSNSATRRVSVFDHAQVGAALCTIQSNWEMDVFPSREHSIHRILIFKANYCCLVQYCTFPKHLQTVKQSPQAITQQAHRAPLSTSVNEPPSLPAAFTERAIDWGCHLTAHSPPLQPLLMHDTPTCYYRVPRGLESKYCVGNWKTSWILLPIVSVVPQSISAIKPRAEAHTCWILTVRLRVCGAPQYYVQDTHSKQIILQM